VQLIIRVFADVDLPIYVRQAGVPTTNNYDVLRTNIVAIPPDIASLSPRDTFWNYAIGNPNSNAVSFTIETELVTTNDLGNDLQVNNSINYEGWGLANLQTSIPTNLDFTANGTAMLFFDQSPTNALATNQKRTYTVEVDPTAADTPLRVTLVWTDPPGNPVTG